ncbi:hypothetical protein An07g09030 [Aspergillus niger]|uniref:Uncharacterized protein n=2 Tax=Aspergillus niger TaxID=5061 RepID=A2QPD1_ASPNC|nr:hypothetical protein An07g09030 [Aspergillus niger]CAK45111.1 hypothetical protein An07g09030 [Aspergillus niger]
MAVVAAVHPAGGGALIFTEFWHSFPVSLGDNRAMGTAVSGGTTAGTTAMCHVRGKRERARRSVHPYPPGGFPGNASSRNLSTNTAPLATQFGTIGGCTIKVSLKMCRNLQGTASWPFRGVGEGRRSGECRRLQESPGQSGLHGDHDQQSTEQMLCCVEILTVYEHLQGVGADYSVDRKRKEESHSLGGGHPGRDRRGTESETERHQLEAADPTPEPAASGVGASLLSLSTFSL